MFSKLKKDAVCIRCVEIIKEIVEPNKGLLFDNQVQLRTI